MQLEGEQTNGSVNIKRFNIYIYIQEKKKTLTVLLEIKQEHGMHNEMECCFSASTSKPRFPKLGFKFIAF